jgi:hypothetical protein
MLMFFAAMLKIPMQMRLGSFFSFCMYTIMSIRFPFSHFILQAEGLQSSFSSITLDRRTVVLRSNPGSIRRPGPCTVLASLAVHREAGLLLVECTKSY